MATVKIEPMMPACVGKIIEADESWKCRKSEVRKRRLRRVAYSQQFLARRNAYRAQSNTKNLINKRNKLLIEARLLHIHEIQVKNEKEIKKNLHIKQKREFLDNIFKINKIELINRGENTIREIIKKELLNAKEVSKVQEAKLKKFNDDKLFIISEGTKRKVEFIKNAERFIRKIIENLHLKGVKKLNIDLITEKGNLKEGITIDVEKKEVLLKNPEVARNLIKKSNYSKFVGQLSGKKVDLSIKNDSILEPKISNVPESNVGKDYKIELEKKKQPIRMMKFDSNIRSPIEARSESKECILDTKSLKIIKFDKQKGSSELIPKSDIQIRSPGLVKVSSQLSSSIQIGKAKSLIKSLPIGNQIPKAKSVEILKKDALFKTKGGIQSKVTEKKNDSGNNTLKDSNTSLSEKSPMVKDTLIKSIYTKVASGKELIAKPKSKDSVGILVKDTLNLDGKSKSDILKLSEGKKSPPTKSINDMPNSQGLEQNQELKKTFSKSFPKAVVTKSEVLKKNDVMCKKVLPKQLEKVKPIIKTKEKSDGILPPLKIVPKTAPNALEKVDHNILIYDSEKYWSSRLYDLYRRMKGESSQESNVSKKCLKRERRRLSTRSVIEKRRMRIYTRLRLINMADSKRGKHTKLFIKPGILKRYGIPALMSCSYRDTNQALCSDTEQKYLIHKLSPNYTNKSHIEYLLDNTNSYVFGIHKHHELLSIARNSLNEDIQFWRLNKLSKYALTTKMSNLEQFIEEVMGEMIINGDLKQESRENMLENNIMRLRYLVNTGRNERPTFTSCKDQKSDETNQLWDKLISKLNISYDYKSSKKISNTNNLWRKASDFIYEEEVDLFKKVYYLSDLEDLNINIDDSILQSTLKTIRIPYNSQDFRFPFIFSKEIKSSKNGSYHRRDFISYVGKLSPWTKMALIQKRKRNKKSI
ncbi:uncharacterized protein cubi_00797 [Cryptosporidium ubiquitum]|uniref:Uncharacterized protein n=1 Tax=Cryptosporidium ubiquitum TaxID=857276 RepID=A0A1J4MD56_9CRYT|nr:uncharacterized protein cubi_00797 [Cryptosporidium ubiquitum]OII71419.1 hypothetical protein cubi_00797 [Cryptosporidium ubiquitum]